MTLFISTELITNPVYKVFYKKLEKEYISKAFELDLPVVFTTSNEIERLHYSNDFDVKFKDIETLQDFLDNKVKDLTYLGNNDFTALSPCIGDDYSVISEKEDVVEEVSNPFPRDRIRQRFQELIEQRESVNELNDQAITRDFSAIHEDLRYVMRYNHYISDVTNLALSSIAAFRYPATPENSFISATPDPIVIQPEPVSLTFIDDTEEVDNNLF